MTWNLRMAAAQRDVWKASQLHAIARRRRVAAAKHSTSSYPGRNLRDLCRRLAVPVREGVCRPCRKQATSAGQDNKFAVDYLSLAAVTGTTAVLRRSGGSERNPASHGRLAWLSRAN